LKPPATIQIGPHTYKLILSDARVVRLGDDTDASFGECDTKHTTITVDPNQAPTMLRDTVIHELLHACMSLIGVTEDPGVDRDAEERIVLRLAPVLLQLVRQRKLIEWLQEEQ
jgi:hypothetical protein